jgi:hypothetical protein
MKAARRFSPPVRGVGERRGRFCSLDGSAARPFTVRDAIGNLPADVVPSGESIQYPVGEKLSIFQCLIRLDQDCSIYPELSSVDVASARGRCGFTIIILERCKIDAAT